MAFEMFCLWFVVGVVVGWLAAALWRGGLGLLGDLIVGTVGAIAAGVLFHTMDLERYAGGSEGSLPVSFGGALVALAIARLVRTMARAGR